MAGTPVPCLVPCLVAYPVAYPVTYLVTYPVAGSPAGKRRRAVGHTRRGVGTQGVCAGRRPAWARIERAWRAAATACEYTTDGRTACSSPPPRRTAWRRARRSQGPARAARSTRFSPWCPCPARPVACPARSSSRSAAGPFYASHGLTTPTPWRVPPSPASTRSRRNRRGHAVTPRRSGRYQHSYGQSHASQNPRPLLAPPRHPDRRSRSR